MKNRRGQPICGKTIEGPTVKDGGRRRPLWRGNCSRLVKTDGMRCWQHRVAEQPPGGAA